MNKYDKVCFKYNNSNIDIIFLLLYIPAISHIVTFIAYFYIIMRRLLSIEVTLINSVVQSFVYKKEAIKVQSCFR